MASFPSFNISPGDIKIVFRESYASETLNERLMGLPLGIAEGFVPSLSDPVVTLGLSPRGLSIANVRSQVAPVSVGISLTDAITLDFTGHDFTVSGDIYVVLQANYLRGSTTTAKIVTQNTAPVGSTEIGICRVTGTGTPGSGGTVDSVVFANFPDRITNLATANQPFGFMAGGDKEALDSLASLIGKYEIASGVKTADFNITADGMINLLNYSGSASLKTITLPDSSAFANPNGSIVRVLSLNGLNGNGAQLQRSGTDLIRAVDGTLSTALALRDFTGHFIELTLITDVAPAQWEITAYELKPQHGGDHGQGGADPIKLDDLATPDDNTDLDVSAARHGLMPKLSGSASDVFKGDGSYGPVPSPAVYPYQVAVAGSPGPNAVTADGTVHRIDASGGSFTMQLPDAAATPDGSIVRLQIEVPHPSNIVTISAFVGQNISLPPNFGNTFLWQPTQRGMFLELFLDKSISAPALWKPSASVMGQNLGNIPIGGWIWWWPPAATATPPPGWVVLDGSVLNDPESPYDGGNVPNLINFFARGFGGAQGGDAGVANANVNTGGASTHNHGGATGLTSIGAFTNVAGGASLGLTTDPHLHGISASSHNPLYVGFLPIMRIK